jgi:hypothetical protein
MDFKESTAIRPLCDDLIRRSIPFLFYTGYCASDLHGHWNGTPVLSKPAPCECIVSSLLALLQSQSPADQPGNLRGSLESVAADLGKRGH